MSASLVTLLCAAGACSGQATTSAANDGGAETGKTGSGFASDAMLDADAGSTMDAQPDPPDVQKPCPPPPPAALQTPESVVEADTLDGWQPMAGSFGHSALGTVWTQEAQPPQYSYGSCESAYWLPEGAAQAIPFGPSSCVQLMAVADTAVYLTVGSDTFAFGLLDGGLVQLGKVGVVGGLLPGPAFVADRLVFWDHVSGNTLLSEPVPLGTAETLAAFPDHGGAMASDGSRLFVETGDFFGATAQLYEVSVPSGTRRSVGVFPSPHQFFVAGGGYVYQANQKDSEIEQVDVKTGELAVAVAVGSSEITGAVADPEYLYFAERHTDVYRRRHCGGSPQLIEHGAAVYYLKHDRDYLYFWDGSNSVERLAKPP